MNEPRPSRGLVLGYDMVLLNEAERSAGRAKIAYGDGDPDREAGASAAAILCAAAACEALLDEELASEFTDHFENASDGFAVEVRDAGSPYERWKVYLKGTAPRKEFHSRLEYQDLVCLYKVRHHVAHRSACFLPYDIWPDRLRDCVSQRRVPVRQAEGMDWTSLLFVHEVAGWAFEVARDWMRLVARYTPSARGARQVAGIDPLLGGSWPDQEH